MSLNCISAIRWSDRDGVAPFIFEGSCNRDVLETWLLCLGESLPPRQASEPPYVLVMDNAAFH